MDCTVQILNRLTRGLLVDYHGISQGAILRWSGTFV